MKPKYKVTGCARFFVFFALFIPIVFFGAAYIRGENGVKIIRDYYHQIIGNSEQPAESNDTYDPEARIRALEKELEAAKEKIRALEEELKKDKN